MCFVKQKKCHMETHTSPQSLKSYKSESSTTIKEHGQYDF